MLDSSILSTKLKQKALRYLAIVFIVFIFPAQVIGKISIATNLIPGLLEESNSNAPYTRAIIRLKELSSDEMVFNYYPSSRASKTFHEKKSDCLFPATANTLSKTFQGPIIESRPLNYAIAFLFSQQEFNLQNLIDHAQRQYNIAYRRGNTFGGNISKLSHHNLVEVNSDQQSFGMLDNGRVDFVVTYMPDARDMLIRPSGREIFYNAEQVFHTQGDSFVCHLTEDNIAFLGQINQAIQTLRTSGELINILGKSYIHP